MRIFAGSLRFRILSLVAAIFLWLFVFMEGYGEVVIPLHVRYVNVPAGSRVSINQASEPLARISGPRIKLLRQMLTGAELELDLAGVERGRVEFTGLEKHVSLQPGLRSVSVSPGSHTVVLLGTSSIESK